MTKSVEVFRMSGAGNLFSVIDNSKYNFNDVELIELARILCTVNNINDFRAEGLLIISEDPELDFDVKFLNPDGSTGMMCGNGGRCAVDFAVSRGISRKKDGILTFSMADNIYYGELIPDGVKLTLPPPIEINYNKEIELDGIIIKGSYINVTSDHFVINHTILQDFGVGFNIESINKFAPKLRNHTDFGARGANINIYRIIGNLIYLFTYERGVEAVTGACGTGAISTAIHCLKNDFVNMPLLISPPSGIPVSVDIKKDYSGRIKNIYLSGHSEIIRKDSVIVTI